MNDKSQNKLRLYMKKKVEKITIVLLSVLLKTVGAIAQGGPTPPNVYEPPPEDMEMYDPNVVPVDGGIGLVLTAGIAFYSRKKIKEQREKNKTA